MSNGKSARDIGIGDNGAIFIAGTDGKAYKWTGIGWELRGNMGTGFVAIAVNGTGTPVALDSS